MKIKNKNRYFNQQNCQTETLYNKMENFEDFNINVNQISNSAACKGLVSNDDDRIKMVRDLNVNELYTIYGKEEEYTKKGILRILKVRDENDREFRLYATDYLASYLTTDHCLIDGVEFIIYEIKGVKVPIINGYEQLSITYSPY